MADLVRKYERIATESPPPTPSKSTSMRTMSLVGSQGSPRLPSLTPAVAMSGLLFTASSEKSLPHCGGGVSCFRCDQLCSAVESKENAGKRKRFLVSEEKNLKIETEDKTCTDGNLRRETPLHARGRHVDADAAEVKSTCAAEIEAYLSAMEKEQQRRFAEKYNYDVVNDLPLEGRYEWIPLNVGAVEETLK